MTTIVYYCEINVITTAMLSQRNRAMLL